MEYSGSSELNPPVPEDEENILAALNRSDLVSSIHLTLTKTFLKKLSSTEGHFSELEDLVLLSQSNVPLTLPRTFRWGPCLRRLHSTRVTFSAPLPLLLSSRDIVDIHLHDFEHRHLSPKALADALSRMAHLRSLSLYVISTANHPTMSPLSLAKKRVIKRVLNPSLSCLKYRGTSKYLDSLLERVDAPRLADIKIAFVNEIQFNEIRSSVTTLNNFINQTEIWKSHRQADILFSELSVSLCLNQSVNTCLKFQVFCKPFRQQVLSMAQICGQLCSFYHMEEIHIKIMPSSSLYMTKLENWNSETCVEKLLYSFRDTKWSDVASDLASDSDLSTEIRPLWVPKGLPPVITKLCICKLGSCVPPLWEAVVSLMLDCWLSLLHPLEVEYEQLGIGELHQSVIRRLGFFRF